MREVEVAVELCGRPDFAGFNAAVIRRCIINEVRFLSVPEVEIDVFQERGLVAFDGEVIMGLTFSNQIGRAGLRGHLP